MKRLFTAVEQGQAQDLKPPGVLADFVEVDTAFEKAAEEFLHEELEYVVVKDWSQADRASISCAPTWMAAPRSWSTPSRTRTSRRPAAGAGPRSGDRHHRPPERSCCGSPTA